MTTANRIAIWGVLAMALALTGFGTGGQAAAAAPTAEPKKLANGNTEREQGTMQVDAGQGTQSLRSVATVVDPKLGEKTAAQLGTAEGQKKLADANASVPSSLGKPGTQKVTSSDVQELANQFAGRTVYSSQAMHMEIINAYVIELDAKSHSMPGVRMKVNFTVSDKDLKLQRAGLEYYPDASKRTQSYVKKKMALTDITIDKLERKDDNTFVVAGRFKTTDLAPGVLAKELKGQALDRVSGRFDFSEVPIRKMGK